MKDHIINTYDPKRRPDTPDVWKKIDAKRRAGIKLSHEEHMREMYERPIKYGTLPEK